MSVPQAPIWRLFFPTAMWLPIPIMIIFVWGPQREQTFLIVASEVLMAVLLAGAIWMTIDMLLMKRFSLYRDRAVKTYRLISSREVFLKEAYIGVESTAMGKILSVVPKGAWYDRINKKVFFDCSLGDGKCLDRFTEACKLLSIHFEKTWYGLKEIRLDDYKVEGKG